MDSLPEDVTVRTLIKRMIAEEAPQSIVRPGKQRLRKSIGNPKKLTDVSMPQSPHMILRSQMKARVQQSRKQIAATAGSSAEHSTRKNMSALRKTKRLEAVPQENLDDYTPRQLLKKFIQTELESSLVKVTTSEMKKSVEKTSQLKTKLQSDSDRFDLSLPAEVTEEQNLPADHKIHKRKKVSVSEFEKAMQQRLDYTTEPQESEQVELCEKSIRPPDISTIVGLINPDFEESTTKPILCRRPVKRKVINEDEFEKGVHNYLEQNKEPEETETERSGPFEKTAGLTDISGMVGSINFGTDESVSKPVLSRRSRRLKLISEDDFEQRVLFDLQQTKGKSFPEVQEAASDNTEKEKSITNAQQNELGVNEPYTSPQQTPSDGMEAVSARNEETRNEFGLNSGLDLKKQREFVVSDKEESVKTPHTGKDQTHLTEQKTLADTDPELEYRAEKFTEDPHGGDKSMDHELEMPKDTEQNLSMQVSQQSTMVRYSEGIVVGNKNDKTGEGHEVNDGRAEDGETGGILADTGRMEYAEEGGEKAEGAKVDNGSVEAEDGENIKDAEVVSERMEGVKADEIMQGAKVKGTESSRLDGEGSALAGLDGEGMAGGDTDDERMEETESDGDIESDEMDEEELIHNDGYEGDDSEARQTFQLSEKALKSSPLLTTPHFLKILGRQAQKPLAKVRGNPKKPTQKRKKTILPSSFVKSVFTHYAKMRVKKEVFRAVDQCLELYFKQLCDDMDVYSKHAKRRTIEKEDLELLMKRQGFITAKTPLNVLIENHLPMECREKLIPMAVSGSKIIPKK